MHLASISVAASVSPFSFGLPKGQNEPGARLCSQPSSLLPPIPSSSVLGIFSISSLVNETSLPV